MIVVRWYLRYGLSYRDVEELLAERRQRGKPCDRLPASTRLGSAEPMSTTQRNKRGSAGSTGQLIQHVHYFYFVEVHSHAADRVWD